MWRDWFFQILISKIIFKVTAVELRRLFAKMCVLDADPAFPRNVDPEQPVPDLRRVLRRVLTLLNPARDEEARFTDFVATLAILSDRDQHAGKLRFAFNMFDFDGDGFVSNSDAFHVLHMLVPDVTDAQLQRLVDRVILEADKDHDGKLSFEEFSQLLTKSEDVFEKLTISWQ